jgi:hypothetical protein
MTSVDLILKHPIHMDDTLVSKPRQIEIGPSSRYLFIIAH